MKLLIADDQQSLHTFLDKMMDWEKLGISQVKHAYDGRETVELVQQFDPDLLIIDIQMPYLNGIDTLKQLHQLACKPKTVILSAYDEFEYAREALRLSVAQYLLKPVDTVQLEEALAEMVEEIKREQQVQLEVILASLLETEHAHAEAGWLVLAEKVWHTFALQSYSILIVTGQLSNQRDAAAFLYRQEPQPAVVAVHAVQGKQYVIFLGWSDARPPAELIRLYEGAAKEWQSSMAQRTLRIGASKPGQAWSELPELLEQSKQASVAAFHGAALLHHYTDMKLPPEGWTIQHYQQFNQAFEERFALEFTVDHVMELIASLFRTFRELLLEPDQVYRLCVYYWSMAVQTLEREQRLNAEYEVPSLEKLQQWFTLDELERYVAGEISRLIAVTDRVAEQVEETVARIKQHVDRHYGEELSLQHVAERFALDKYQLSRLFKQQYGINYWQYVTTVRLDKAAELLVGTNLKNSAIAEMTGFVDESHLSKTFKKHFTLSPKEYRAGKRGASL